jgi:hypothetical protein
MTSCEETSPTTPPEVCLKYTRKDLPDPAGSSTHSNKAARYLKKQLSGRVHRGDIGGYRDTVLYDLDRSRARDVFRFTLNQIVKQLRVAWESELIDVDKS